MIFGNKNSEAAIRVGAEGAEWLAWRMNAESLVSGRMTSSYSVEAALDQWLGRAKRFGLKPKKIWLIAGADSCAHRRLRLPGTDPNVIAQALPLAADEELPLPLDKMWWTSKTHVIAGEDSTVVDVVATPRDLFLEWEKALDERGIEIATRVPEGPLLWQELAAIRGSEIGMLTVWGERRATIVRGDEENLNSVQAFVRGTGESWEALAPDLKRALSSRTEAASVLSIFTSERLRKRVVAIKGVLPAVSENRLNLDVFHGVPEDVAVAVSLLALRRMRIEKRTPGLILAGAEAPRAAPDLREVARRIDIPKPLWAVAVLVLICGYLYWKTDGTNQALAKGQMKNRLVLANDRVELDAELRALKDVKRYHSDWGSFWLKLSQIVPEGTLFQDMSHSVGAGIRINGNTASQASLGKLESILRETGYLKNLRIQKTEMADKKLRFNIFADFTGEVDWYSVDQPYFLPKGEEAAEPDAEPDENVKKAKKRGAKNSNNKANRKKPRRVRKKAEATGPEVPIPTNGTTGEEGTT